MGELRDEKLAAQDYSSIELVCMDDDDLLGEVRHLIEYNGQTGALTSDECDVLSELYRRYKLKL